MLSPVPNLKGDIDWEQMAPIYEQKILDALETGYKEASTAIFDANITNVIAAALMWYFGSGPVRGFAIVLLIGIITSVFTAVNFTRLLVALWVRAKRPRELHI